MTISVLAAAAGMLDRPTSEQLIGLARAGVAVDVVCAPGDPWEVHLTQAGLAVYPVRTRGRLDVPAIRSLRRLLEAKDYDVLHAYNAKMLGCALVAARGKPRLKIIGFRGYLGHVSYLRPSSWLGYLNPRVDCIVCVSRAVARFFLELRFLGRALPPHKIVTIYKGHEPAWYGGPPPDLAEFGVPAGAFTVCFCGRDRPRKGIHVLVEAAGRLDPGLPIHYLLVGRMDANPRLREQIRSSVAHDRIHLTGFRADAPLLAGASDVFALPSLDREGLSRAVLEAMAQGTPAIVSDAGGLPEQVEHGVSGLVVAQADAQALADAIGELYRDLERTQAMGQRARQRVVDVFSCARTVRETISLYEKLSGKQG